MSERKTVRKWFWAWDFEKEEEWLNDMTMSGWVLEKVGFATYDFVRCEPGEYIIHLQMFDTDTDYMQFMNQINAEYIDHFVKWVYFRRKAEYGIFEINSNLDSRIAHLNRIGQTLSAIGGANILIGVVNSSHSHLSILNLLVGCVLMYGLGRIHGKKEELEHERMLHE